MAIMLINSLGISVFGISSGFGFKSTFKSVLNLSSGVGGRFKFKISLKFKTGFI